jgi:hypothetical protein
MAVSACMCPVLFVRIPILNSFHLLIPFFFFFWSNVSLYPLKAHSSCSSFHHLLFLSLPHHIHPILPTYHLLSSIMSLSFFCSFLAFSFIFPSLLLFLLLYLLLLLLLFFSFFLILYLLLYLLFLLMSRI